MALADTGAAELAVGSVPPGRLELGDPVRQGLNPCLTLDWRDRCKEMSLEPTVSGGGGSLHRAAKRLWRTLQNRVEHAIP